MDHYAPYVWSAYGVTLIGLAALVAASLWHARRWRQRLERLELLDEDTRRTGA